jgi:hypothetical protein
VNSLAEAYPGLDLVPQGGELLHHALGVFRVFPQVRVFRLLLKFGELGFFTGDVKDAPVGFGFFPGWRTTGRSDLA